MLTLLQVLLEKYLILLVVLTQKNLKIVYPFHKIQKRKLNMNLKMNLMMSNTSMLMKKMKVYKYNKMNLKK